MIKHYLNVGKYKYCVEYFKYDELPVLDRHEESFVMIRKFELMNDIIVDRDIYFISKDLFDSGILENDYINNDKKYFSKIVFPSSNSPMCYSSHYSIFNDTFLDSDLFRRYSVYNLFEKNQNEEEIKFVDKKIKCNQIRIYHPHIRTTNNLIVHVKNVINNITFHYICNKYSNFNINSDNESRYENNIYSEYITVYIPDIYELFGSDISTKQYNCYFVEDLNIINLSEKYSEELRNNAKFTVNGKQYIGLGLLTNKSKIIQNENDQFEKIYLKNKNVFEQNYLYYPIDVILYPYSYIDEPNNLYILDDELTPISQIFVDEYQFSIQSICDFDKEETSHINVNGEQQNILISNPSELSIITIFDYPNRDIFEKIFGNQSLTEAYCYYNNIKKEDRTYYTDEYGETHKGIYTMKLDELKKLYMEQLDEISKLNISYINENVKKQIFGINYKHFNDDEALQRLKELRMESFIEEYVEEYGATINFFGTKIEIATDKKFKNIIYEKTYELSQQNILNWIQNDNDTPIDLFGVLGNGKFRFSLSNIFDDWNQLPKYLIVKTTFIDRLLGINILSNPIIITKEKFKYMINHKEHYRLSSLYDQNKDMKEYNFNDTSFNFVNNINCIINKNGANINLITDIKNKVESYKNSEDVNESLDKIIGYLSDKIISLKNNSEYNENSNYTQVNKQIFYKPIFYKIQILDNIILREGQTQIIALDLHKYMTKVKLFKLNIEDKKYNEMSRNNNYVLFKVNANELINLEGKYNIYNEDNEYISSGQWKIS